MRSHPIVDINTKPILLNLIIPYFFAKGKSFFVNFPEIFRGKWRIVCSVRNHIKKIRWVMEPNSRKNNTQPSVIPGKKKMRNRPFPTYRANRSSVGRRIRPNTPSQRCTSLGRAIRSARSRLQSGARQNPSATEHRNWTNCVATGRFIPATGPRSPLPSVFLHKSGHQ